MWVCVSVSDWAGIYVFTSTLVCVQWGSCMAITWHNMLVWCSALLLVSRLTPACLFSHSSVWAFVCRPTHCVCVCYLTACLLVLSVRICSLCRLLPDILCIADSLSVACLTVCTLFERFVLTVTRWDAIALLFVIISPWTKRQRGDDVNRPCFSISSGSHLFTVVGERVLPEYKQT